MKLVSRTVPAIITAAAIAMIGSACEPVDDGQTAASQPEKGKAAGKDTKQADNSSKGKGALTWGNWEVVGKLQVKNSGLDMYQVDTRVKNVGDSTDTGIFTVTILKGTEILGTADCSTADIEPGGVGTANCFSTDDFKQGWTEVTIEDSF